MAQLPARLRPFANDYSLLAVSSDGRHPKEPRSRQCNPLYVLVVLLAVLGVGVAVARHFGLPRGSKQKISLTGTLLNWFLVKFPSLTYATIDELSEGLSNGHFTSVDLVKVNYHHFSAVMQSSDSLNRLILRELTRSTTNFMLLRRRIQMPSTLQPNEIESA
jgi:hypothetical protein